jgi:hypothetical protein
MVSLVPLLGYRATRLLNREVILRLVKSVLFSALIAMQASAAGTGILMQLTVLDPSVKSGSKIMVQVTTINQSKKPVTYENVRRACDYSVVVRTSNGALAPETAYKKQLVCGGGQLRMTGRNISVTPAPHQSDNEQIEITELYDMSPPGTYSVQIDRTFPTVGPVSSNVVTVDVTP